MSSNHSSKLMAFRSMRLLVSVRIGRFSTSVGELAGLKCGETFKLDTPLGAPFELVVEGEPLAEVEPVASEKQVSVKLLSAIQRKAR